MNENEYRKNILIPLLTSMGYRCYVYGKNDGFVPPKKEEIVEEDVKHKVPDILVFHQWAELPSPFGIELKNGDSFSDLTKAMVKQIPDYMKLSFKCEAEKWEGKAPLFCLTTINALENKENGAIYSKHYTDGCNFFLERFAWRIGFGIMYLNTKDAHIVLSFNQKNMI